MKVAARFPIKSNPWLFYLIVFSHFFVFLSGMLLLKEYWLILILFCICCASFYYARLQYLCITHSVDDLCWSGESWLMQGSLLHNQIIYMDLMSTSWITAHFCLLKFSENDQEHVWLFSRKSLGERLYRELCYLAKLDMKTAN